MLKFEIGKDSCCYAVFDDEDSADNYATDNPDAFNHFACWNGYLNALSVHNKTSID